MGGLTGTGILDYAEQTYANAPLFPPSIGLLAGVLKRVGETKRVEDLLQRLGPSEGCKVPAGLAAFHLVCGENDQAAYWVEKAIEQRDFGGL